MTFIYSFNIIISIIYRSLGTLPPAAASQPEPRALMKRGGQTTLSLSGSMRLTSPASSLSACSAVSARTPRTAALRQLHVAPEAATDARRRHRGAWRLHDSAQVCDRTFKARTRARGCAIVLFYACKTYIRAEGPIKVCKYFLNFHS